jgi:Ca-activated chloride channel family protein
VSVEEEAFDLIRHNLGNANMFTFGIGSSVNRHLIEGMARVGMGEPFIITKPQEAPEKAQKFRKLIQSPVLTGITVDFGRFKVYDVEPPSIPDVLADRPVIVFGKWRGKPRGHIKVRGTSGNKSFTERLDAAHARPLEANSALRYLWARHRITLLADYNRLSPKDERVQEVTSLGLTYHLLTAYTSFIAVDTRVRVVDGKAVTVKQPLPLPQGVSDLAVGDRMYAKSRTQAFAAAPLTVAKESTTGKGWLKSKDERLSPDTTSSEKINIEVKEIVVSGGLPERSVKAVIESAMPVINNCYRKEHSSPKGEVVFTLVIGPDGRVIKLLHNFIERGLSASGSPRRSEKRKLLCSRVTTGSIEKGQSKYKDFERCMVKMLKALQFPAKAGREEVVVTITFILG